MKRLSTRTLKWITTILIVIPLVLMLAGPWVIRRGRGVTPKAYFERVALYGGILGLSALGAGIGAFAILRREQEFYRAKAVENMQSLIEATRQDTLRKKLATTGGADAERQDG